MATKIEKKITGWAIKKEQEPVTEELKKNEYLVMGDHIKRDEKLYGATIKIKSPNTEYAVFVTINHIVLNAGTEFEKIHPYEVFIQSKDNDHMQWVNVLARAISALLRAGKDIDFFVTEMKETTSPRSGYMRKGKFVPSLVADIGYCIEEHFYSIGYWKKTEDKNMGEFIEKKKEEFKGKEGQLCTKCNSKSLFLMDGCMTCVSCGDSKCG